MLNNFLHFHEASVGSTQQEALRLWQECGSELYFSADEQTMGRGRMQRVWSSPVGNLSLSLALTPSRDLMYSLGFIASLSVLRAIQGFMAQSDGSIVLKWPNDVLLGGAKCAGILIEYHQHPCEALILGIGVNIRSVPENAPYPVTSLLEQGIVCTATEFQDAFIREFQLLRSELQRSGANSIYKKWSNAAHPAGTELNIRTLKENFSGTYLGLTSTGTLQVKLDTGEIREVISADCFIAEGI